MSEVSMYVGLLLDEAEGLANANGLRTRVVEVDGVGRVITMDFRRDRVNFYLKNNEVIKATIG